MALAARARLPPVLRHTGQRWGTRTEGPASFPRRTRVLCGHAGHSTTQGCPHVPPTQAHNARGARDNPRGAMLLG